MSDRAFPFIRMNQRQAKPRTQGLTEIRGPYYTPMGRRYLEDILETMAEYVDSLKFAGGSFTLMPRERLREIIELAHRYGVLVSTGGFIEHVLAHNAEAVPAYIQECVNVGFDILEISSGFISLPADDWLRLVERVQKERNPKSASNLAPAAQRERRNWKLRARKIQVGQSFRLGGLSMQALT